MGLWNLWDYRVLLSEVRLIMHAFHHAQAHVSLSLSLSLPLSLNTSEFFMYTSDSCRVESLLFRKTSQFTHTDVALTTSNTHSASAYRP